MFTVQIDLSDLDALFDIGNIASKEARKAQQNIAQATYAHIVELANQKLHSRRRIYLKALNIFEDNGDIVVSLDASVDWIESGMRPRNLLDDLLSSDKAKTNKETGKKYIVVPFQHNKTKQDMTPAQQNLLQTIKKNLRQVGASVNGIENDSEGNPKLGLVRKLDIMNSPLKMFNGPGQGSGPIGDVKQGPTGIPFLQGVNVYQTKVKTKDGDDKIQRTVMTFRVASEDHKDQNRWNHPGLQAVNIFEEAARWAQQEIENKIGPALMNQIAIQLSK